MPQGTDTDGLQCAIHIYKVADRQVKSFGGHGWRVNLQQAFPIFCAQLLPRIHNPSNTAVSRVPL